MFRNVIALELKKHAKSAWSLLALLAAVQIVVMAIFYLADRSSMDLAVRYALGVVIGTSVWFFPPLLGTSTGARLRRDPERIAEEMLPASPSQRVFGAYFGGLLYLALFLFASLVVLMFAFAPPPQVLWEAVILFLPAILHFHLLNFTFAYWIRMSILGAALASLLVIFQFVSAAFLLNGMIGDSDFVALMLGIAGCFLTTMFCLLFIAKRMERSVPLGWWVAYPIGVLLASGPACFAAISLVVKSL